MIPHEKTFGEKLRYIFAPVDAKGIGFIDRLALTTLGAQDAWLARPEVAKEKQLLDTLEQQAAQKGTSRPPLIIYQAKGTNAASILTGSIAVDTDFSGLITPAQMSGVLGHEMAHHEHRLRDMAIAGGGLAVTRLAYDLLLKPQLHKLRPKNLIGAVAFGAAEITGQLVVGVQLLMGYKRAVEFEADRESARATGKPQDLIGALEVLDARQQALQKLDVKKRLQQNHPDEPKPSWQQMISDTVREIEPEWVRRTRQNPLSVLNSHPATHRRIARLKLIEEKMAAEAAAAPKVASR